MSDLVLVTGGAGYVGSAVCREILASGRRVRVLDCLLHDQDELARALERDGAEVVRSDVLDGDARRRVLDGVHTVVHLAAIVGDPACAQDPDRSQAVNVEGTRSLASDARARGVARFVFASTCSNYGRMADSSVPVDETGTLAPVSLYARQKVTVEQELLGSADGSPAVTCLRLATVYGVSERMRFDLTVNEFTRDLWADRELAVFGERFWRPYVHVRDAARAIRLVLDTPGERIDGRVFNVGRTDQNFRKLDLVAFVRELTDRGTIVYVEQADDPRDYKVSFERIRTELGFDLTMTVSDGVAEVMAALEAGAFPDPFTRRYRNVP